MFRNFVVLSALALSFKLVAQETPPPPTQDDGTAYAVSTLVARANQNDGYSLPAGTILGIASPRLNNRGDVAFDADVIGGTEEAGIWFIPNGGTGSSIFRATESGRLLSDPGLNNQGDLVFSQFDFGVSDGIFQSSGVSRAVTLVVRPETDQALSFPAINDAGTVITRVVNAAGERNFKMVRGGSSSIFAREGVKDSQGKMASYLFRPVLNNQGYVASKVRLGATGQVDETQPDEIRLWKPDGSYEIVATDVHGQPSSLFMAFGNSVGISDARHVVFVATISGDKQGVFLFGEGKVKAIAIEGQGDLEAIEAFAPVVNSKGLVAFRGRLNTGKSAIFTADWNGFKPVIKQGDLVPSDVETAKIYDLDDNQGFVGGLAINDSGVIAFDAGILSKDGERFLGQGIYLLSTQTPAARR